MTDPESEPKPEEIQDLPQLQVPDIEQLFEGQEYSFQQLIDYLRQRAQLYQEIQATTEAIEIIDKEDWKYRYGISNRQTTVDGLNRGQWVFKKNDFKDEVRSLDQKDDNLRETLEAGTRFFTALVAENQGLFSVDVQQKRSCHPRLELRLGDKTFALSSKGKHYNFREADPNVKWHVDFLQGKHGKHDYIVVNYNHKTGLPKTAGMPKTDSVTGPKVRKNFFSLYSEIFSTLSPQDK